MCAFKFINKFFLINHFIDLKEQIITGYLTQGCGFGKLAAKYMASAELLFANGC
jgi:hypothetical protein